MSQKLLSAAVVIGALRVNIFSLFNILSEVVLVSTDNNSMPYTLEIPLTIYFIIHVIVIPWVARLYVEIIHSL